MKVNQTTNWSHVLAFVQWGMNASAHETTKLMPYQVVFGTRPKMRLATNVKIELLQNMQTGVDEENSLNMLGCNNNEGLNNKENVNNFHHLQK